MIDCFPRNETFKGYLKKLLLRYRQGGTQSQSADNRRPGADSPWSHAGALKMRLPRPFYRKAFWQSVFILWMCLCCGGFWGCSDKSELSQMTFLVRVGDCAAYKDDFEAAFKALSPGYAADGEAGDSKMTRLKLRVLDQLAEELLLCRHAKELNVHISTAELDDTVQKIKAQYPPGVFEEIMLEHAVPFNVWKKRLKARLLMMKVIETELVNELDITYDDAAQFLKDPLSGSATAPSTGENNKVKQQGVEVLGRLRRYQSERAYGQWLETLKSRYTVEWNKEEIKKVIDQNPGQNQLPKEVE